MCTTPAPARSTHRRVRHLDDERLLLDARRGHPDAYAELYRRYHGDARSLARSLVGAANAEDVVAEAFTRVLHALRSGHGPVDHPVKYLMVAVRSAATDLHRQRTRQRDLVTKLHVREAVVDDDRLQGDDPLVRAFQSLSARWRQVLWWSEIEGLTASEIGFRLGIRPAAAAALTYRARRALRDAYAADGSAVDLSGSAIAALDAAS